MRARWQEGQFRPIHRKDHTMYASPSSPLRARLAFIAFAAGITMTMAGAQVATGTTGIDNSGDYKKEVQACLSGRTQQDQATCLREARNAKADHRQGASSSNSADYSANAALRCNGLTGEDKAACQARVTGYGSASGSVAGGGVLTSVETVVMPAGANSVLIEPKTAQPVVLVPAGKN